MRLIQQRSRIGDKSNMLFRSLYESYHKMMARRHFRLGQNAQCLHHLDALIQSNIAFTQDPKLSAYLALCHFRMQIWENISAEVETALFLLRRFIQEDKESFVLWQELKSHLALLQSAERQNQTLSNASVI